MTFVDFALESEEGSIMPSDAYGFAGAAYNQIIVFRSGEAMNMAIAANPHMTAIMGGDGYTKESFPGVYIAGIKHEANPLTWNKRERGGDDNGARNSVFHICRCCHDTRRHIDRDGNKQLSLHTARNTQEQQRQRRQYRQYRTRHLRHSL